MAISRSDRAKQFMAFDALKGLQEAYRLKELEFDERKDLSEETLKELNEDFNNVLVGDYVIIKYYKNRKYIQENGVITKKDCINKKIYLDKENMININDIIEINRI